MVDLQQPTDDFDTEEALRNSSMHDALEPESGIVWSRFAMLIGLLAMLLILGGVNMLVFVMALVAALIIHEAGHYLVARWSGMKVTEFFIGFGPRIFSFTRGETTYGLKVGVPLGAYVRIIGMNNLETVDPEDEPRAYRAATWPRRVATILAGPATHFIVAIGLMAVLLWQQGLPIAPADDDDLSGPWAIGQVIPFSAAEEAGLESRDELLSIDGADTSDFTSLSAVIGESRGEVVELQFERDGVVQTADARIGERLTATGSAGYTGLYEGDLVVSISGEDVDNYREFAELARDRIGEQVSVGVVYGGSLHQELVTIDEVVTEDAVQGFLGVSRGLAFEDPTSFGQSLLDAPGEVASLVGQIAETTPRLVTTSDGLRSLFGISWIDPPEPEVVEVDDPDQQRPVATFDENRPISLIGATRIADQLEDPYDVLFLLIGLNLFFGLFNLLPLLPLDGGHIALATYERIRSFGGRRYHADAAKLLPITYVIVVVVMFVAGMAMLRDIFDPIQL